MFTVGEFSRICQVSIKTLHHYDRIGLLAPLKVDPFSGYRYYGQQQVEKNAADWMHEAIWFFP